MPRKTAPKPNDPEEYKRFLETARKIEADETEEGAERGFKRVLPSSKTPQKGQKTDLSSD